MSKYITYLMNLKKQKLLINAIDGSVLYGHTRPKQWRN